MRTMLLRALCAAVLLATFLPPTANAGVIPLPRQMTPVPGVFRLSRSLVIVATTADERNVASFLKTFLAHHGVIATVEGEQVDQAAIRLSARAHDPSLGPEGYRMLSATGGVSIEANAGPGLFYGLQTLEQLAVVDASGDLVIPGTRVADWPEYEWRGIHLDVSRHFFPVQAVEQYIDLASRYKLNTFHWHLTDDQGWRIQIEKYPRLTTVGGCRDGTQVGGEGSQIVDDRRYCGYYTQAQIRDVVAYARARYVTIVPEIEGPGHSVSAVSAYPWLGCDGKQYPVRELWGVSTEIMCPSEKTFGFIDDVFGEVAALFPGPYIHIGGDEVPKDDWMVSPFVNAMRARDHLANYDAVQGYFTRRVEQIANEHRRRIVGWDEILDGGVSRRATVMAWQSSDRGAIAAKRGNDVVMTPDGSVYLDAAQGNQDYEPLSIGGYLTLEMVYDYDPMPPGLTAAQSRHVLGAQANVWSEYIPTSDHLFYMLLPRELAVAELCWTPRSQMNWYDFESRLGGELTRLESDGYHYRIPDVGFRLSLDGGLELPEQRYVANETDVAVDGSPVSVSLAEIAPSATIHFTSDGRVPSLRSPVYSRALSVALAEKQTLTVTAVAFLPDGRKSAPSFLRVYRRAGP